MTENEQGRLASTICESCIVGDHCHKCKKCNQCEVYCAFCGDFLHKGIVCTEEQDSIDDEMGDYR